MNARCFPALRTLFLAAAVFILPAGACAQTFYSHGDPSGDEQLTLELINRARANPPAEGVRLGRAAEFAGYAARPPLAFNSQLNASSRAHNDDMISHNYLSHTSQDGRTILDRVGATGYPTVQVTENIVYGFPDATTAFNALMIDDGQPDLGHRRNFLEFDRTALFLREAGIAYGAGGVSTEDLGWRGIGFVCGVVYNNAGDFYAPGQGLAGVRVESPGSSYYTVTSTSGGYSLPVDLLPAGGADPQTLPVTFTHPDGRTRVQSVTVSPSGTISGRSGGLTDAPYVNAKLDVQNGFVAVQNASVSLRVQQASAVAVTGQKATLVFSRAGGDLGSPLTVNYSVKGTAVGGVDYQTLSGIAVIPAGSASLKMKVKAIDHPDFAPGLSLKIKLKAGPGYDLVDVTTAKVTISSGR